MILDRTKEFRSSTTITAATATISSTATVADVTQPLGVESMASAVLGEVPTRQQQVSSRYLGLVVVPGDVIVKLEVERRRGEGVS